MRWGSPAKTIFIIGMPAGASKGQDGWMGGVVGGGLCVSGWVGVHVVCAHHMQVYTKSEGLVC